MDNASTINAANHLNTGDENIDMSSTDFRTIAVYFRMKTLAVGTRFLEGKGEIEYQIIIMRLLFTRSNNRVYRRRPPQFG